MFGITGLVVAKVSQQSPISSSGRHAATYGFNWCHISGNFQTSILSSPSLSSETGTVAIMHRCIQECVLAAVIES